VRNVFFAFAVLNDCMEQNQKRSTYRPAPISDEICRQLEKKYGIAAEQLKKMAKELKFGRPKLEMHLICLANEAKKRIG
jgi:Zn-dependent peptidase ImmA (M78 family)